MKRKGGERGADALTYLAMFTILLIFGGPLLWVLSLSFRSAGDVFASPLQLVPDQPTWENYQTVITSGRFGQYLTNSLKLALIGSVGATLAAVPAAYAASRMRFRGQDTLLVLVLAVQMISPLVILIPLYRYLSGLGLLNTHGATGMVYIAVLTPLATWIMRDFFDAIPGELDEAAMVDGCTRFTAFLRIILPASRTGLVAVFTLLLIMSWAEFVIPFVLLSDPSALPISVGIYTFQGFYQGSAMNILAAGSILAILPAVLVFVVLQRYVVSAFLAGSVKA